MKKKKAIGYAVGVVALVVVIGSLAAYSLTGLDPVSLLANVLAPAPSLKLTSDVKSVAPGGTAHITWASVNGGTCTSSGLATGGAANGTAAVHPLKTTTYYVQCTSSPYTVVKPITITVMPTTQLTGTLYSDVASVVAGGTAHLVWSSNNATSCKGTNFNTSGATAGTMMVHPRVATTYGLACTGAGTTVTQSATVGILAHAPPTVTLSTDGAYGIVAGSTAHITWATTDATSCSSVGFSTGGAMSGTVAVNPEAQTSYSISCTGPGGSATASPVVVHILPPPPPQLTMTSDVKSVVSGGAAHITWASVNAKSCVSQSFAMGGALNGTVTVNPTATTTYYLSCTSTPFTIVKSVTVNVTP
jgi:hypothetical protein